MLRRALTQQVFRSQALLGGASRSSAAGLHSTTASSSQAQAQAQPVSSASSAHLQQQVECTLKGVLGLTSAEARRLLEAMPSLVSEQPATLAKRMQLLNASLGVSGARLRTLIAQKPALLSSSASQMELRSIAGIRN